IKTTGSGILDRPLSRTMTSEFGPRPGLRSGPLEKRLDAGDGTAQDQRMDVVGAFIGVDRLQVLRVAHHVVLAGDAVAAMHVARHPRDVERLAAIVALD